MREGTKMLLVEILKSSRSPKNLWNCFQISITFLLACVHKCTCPMFRADKKTVHGHQAKAKKL